ncbi:hypothetical protein GCM10011363_42580 [Marivita lacus]|uniref:Uncharacterized protein n=1 Tax=Marivita lacus TaxID=1323742 RepID=A0ABQ1LBT3_9RHOB|nr:hypothetical protein GCM10011363_42580 [Marivita lacus]
MSGTAMTIGADENSSDDERARMQACIIEFEDALADYVARFGMTEKARSAFRMSAELQGHDKSRR